jgi:hypothetical protein
MKSNRWFAVRMAFIAFWMICAFSSVMPLLPIPLEFLVIIVIYGCFTTRFVAIGLYKKLGHNEIWLRPSWFLNPFQDGQPFQFAHLIAISWVVFALSGLLLRFVSNTRSVGSGFPMEVFPGAFGIGIYLGVQWAVFSCRTRFK